MMSEACQFELQQNYLQIWRILLFLTTVFFTENQGDQIFKQKAPNFIKNPQKDTQLLCFISGFSLF